MILFHDLSLLRFFSNYPRIHRCLVIWNTYFAVKFNNAKKE